MHTLDSVELKWIPPKKTGHSASAELVFLVVIEVSGVILNCGVLLVIYLRFKFLRDKNRYILLGNILLCDFILLFFIIPTSIKFASCEIESCTAVLLDTFCSSVTFLFEFSYICAVFTQACLSFDTVLKVQYSCSPFLRRKNYWVVVVVSWLVSLTPSVISLLPNMKRENFTFYVDLQQCAGYGVSHCSYQIYILSLIHIVIVPVIPGSYFYLAVMARGLRRRLGKQQHDIPPPTLHDVGSLTYTPASPFTDNSSKAILAVHGLSRPSVGDSVLQDIMFLFTSSATGGENVREISPSKLSLVPDTLLASSFFPRISPITQSKDDISTQKAPIKPRGSDSSPKTKSPQTLRIPSLPIDEDGQRAEDSLSKQSNKRLVQRVNSVGGGEHNHSPVLIDKAIQTSLTYKSTSPTSDMSDGNNTSNLKPTSVCQDPQPSSERSYPPALLKSEASDTVPVVKSAPKTSKESTRILRSKRWRNQHRPKRRRSETPTPEHRIKPRRPSGTLLDEAVSTLCEHGLLLMATVYGCSLPYALVNKCLMLNIPSPVTTVAACLYYSTCIWYPLIYFFMSANFRRQLSLATNGGNAS